MRLMVQWNLAVYVSSMDIIEQPERHGMLANNDITRILIVLISIQGVTFALRWRVGPRASGS